MSNIDKATLKTFIKGVGAVVFVIVVYWTWFYFCINNIK